MLNEKEEISHKPNNLILLGIGSSRVSISTNGLVEVAPVHMKSATWNPYEYLGRGDGFSNCTFSLVFWLPSFWALIGFKYHVKRELVKKEILSNTTVMYGIINITQFPLSCNCGNRQSGLQWLWLALIR